MRSRADGQRLSSSPWVVVTVLALVLALSSGTKSEASETEFGWTSVAAPVTGTAYHAAANLGDGRIIITGGIMQDGTPTNRAEIFDPRDDVWTKAANMRERRDRHASLALLDGRILAIGGMHYGTESAEIYDPDANTWTRAGHMSTARWGFAAALLHDGRVLVAGGKWYEELTSADIFDPVTNSWSPAAPMRQARAWVDSSPTQHAAVLSDGRVIVGFSEGVLAEIYDPALDAWTDVSALPMTSSAPHTLVALQSGEILGIPQVFDNGTPKKDTDNVSSALRIALQPAQEEIDGLDRNERFAEPPVALLYDPGTDAWRLTQGMAAAGTQEPVVSALPDGSVLVVGGQWSDEVQIYSPAENTWMRARSMRENRFAETATALPDGRVLLVGGSDEASGVYGNGAETFDRVPPRADTGIQAAQPSVDAAGASLAVSATLASANTTLESRELLFYTTVGEVCRARTDANGRAACLISDPVQLASLVAARRFLVRFAGDGTNWPSFATKSF